MNNLLKMEKYQLSHNIFYWCGLIGIFLIVRKYRIGILYIEAKKRLDVSPTLSSNNTLLKRRLNNPIPQKYQLWNSL